MSRRQIEVCAARLPTEEERAEFLRLHAVAREAGKAAWAFYYQATGLHPRPRGRPRKVPSMEPSALDVQFIDSLRKNLTKPFSRSDLEGKKFRARAFSPHKVGRNKARALIEAALATGTLVERPWAPYTKFKRLAVP